MLAREQAGSGWGGTLPRAAGTEAWPRGGRSSSARQAPSPLAVHDVAAHAGRPRLHVLLPRHRCRQVCGNARGGGCGRAWARMHCSRITAAWRWQRGREARAGTWKRCRGGPAAGHENDACGTRSPPRLQPAAQARPCARNKHTSTPASSPAPHQYQRSRARRPAGCRRTTPRSAAWGGWPRARPRCRGCPCGRPPPAAGRAAGAGRRARAGRTDSTVSQLRRRCIWADASTGGGGPGPSPPSSGRRQLTPFPTQPTWMREPKCFSMVVPPDRLMLPYSARRQSMGQAWAAAWGARGSTGGVRRAWPATPAGGGSARALHTATPLPAARLQFCSLGPRCSRCPPPAHLHHSVDHLGQRRAPVCAGERAQGWVGRRGKRP